MPDDYRALMDASPQFASLHRTGLVARRCRSRGARSLYAGQIKRHLDIVGASIALVVVSPALLAAALAWLAVHGRPILFRQVRIGQFEKPFRVYKLRTMTDARNDRGELLPDELRLTKLGALFRKWSIDELPQLLNVLEGSMSLVGPRPLLVRYIPRYTLRQRRRHVVKPGLTGLGQALGKTDKNWAIRLEADVAYANSIGFGLDAAIVALTLLELARRILGLAESAPDLVEFWGSAGSPAPDRQRFPVDEQGN